MTNKELDLAWQFVEKTDRNIFLTGKAGTGKTTFLHTIREKSLKRYVVVAPTGVAAINAKGVTIHSFFQMAFGPILPIDAQTNEPNNPAQKKFNRKKINIIRSLDLLIIDEISMVRADLLDGIDQVLRKYKDQTRVFGGVQVLMIGDLQQLAPVVKDHEWQILSPYYKTAFFFSSKAFQESNSISIELKHIYRQQNQKFINILNEIRNNNISDTSINELNKRCNPNFSPTKDEGYITLTTHNNQADKINNQQLAEINLKPKKFIAEVEGDFPEHTYPTHFNLELKIGSQVMFIKNDSNPEKRYYNGKIGTITKFYNNIVYVKCPDDEFEIETTPEKWENINFTLNNDTKEITENIKGSYSQIPLRLAWAITIHKSQGLTFEKAIIDVQLSFAHGQTYVALSRCKTLEGMILLKPIEKRSIISDNKVISFTKNIEDNPPTNQDLTESEKQYQLNLIIELFNYKQLYYPINRALKICYQYKSSLKGNYIDPLTIIKEHGIGNLIKIGNGFEKQLSQMSVGVLNPEEDKTILARITKGMQYFINQTKEYIEKPLEDLSFSTENKAVDKELKDQLNKFNELLKAKNYCFNGLANNFNASKYMKLRAMSVLQKVKPPKAVKAEVNTDVNPKLFGRLRSYRYEISQNQDIPPFQVFTQDTLYLMCEALPLNKQLLKKVNGMGKIRVNKYGDDIIDIIREYCEESNIDTSEIIDVQEKTQSKKETEKGTTQKISLDLLNEGLSISEIAKKRELVEGTIESHLALFIKDGKLKLSKVIGKEKSEEIISAIKSSKFEGLVDLKTKLDDKYSFGELRMALNELHN